MKEEKEKVNLARKLAKTEQEEGRGLSNKKLDEEKDFLEPHEFKDELSNEDIPF